MVAKKRIFLEIDNKKTMLTEDELIMLLYNSKLSMDIGIDICLEVARTKNFAHVSVYPHQVSITNVDKLCRPFRSKTATVESVITLYSYIQASNMLV